jgi:cell division topological specificity factor
MGFFGLFGGQKKDSASQAKERLQILISHERQNRHGPDFLPAMQQEILSVVKKYVEIQDDQVNIRLDQQGDASVLELNVILPER